MGSEKRRIKAKFVTEVSQAELACRIFEHMSGIHGNGAGRPYPTSPELSMGAVKQTDPQIYFRVMAASKAAMEYFAECLNTGSVPS